MITFISNNVKFVFRIAGIAIEDRKVLIHRSIHDDFWAMPGGRCELLENSKETLIREMKEELNINVKVIRILYFVENFFNYDNIRHHEVAIYYLMQIPKTHCPSIHKSAFKGREEDNELIFKWYDIDKLGEIKLYPTFLCDKLCNIKSYPEHIIHMDN